MFTVAMVVVTYNRAKWLQKNLASINNQAVSHIFIIDNNSTDQTESVVNHFIETSLHPVTYHRSTTNLGGAGGFALGCQLALAHANQFTHIWLSDDDVTFDKTCLKQLEPYLDQNNLLQPMRFDQQGNNAEASSVNIDLSSIAILNHKRGSVMRSAWRHQQTPFALADTPFEGVVVPRAVFNAIGIPDKRFFIFSDDLDFCLKAKSAGFGILCIPKAKMTRLNCVRANKIPTNWKSYFIYRNFFYIQKHYGKNQWVKKRPYLIALGVMLACLITGNFKGIRILKDAISDAMNSDFPLNNKYIPQ